MALHSKEMIFLFHSQGPAAPKDTLIMLVDCSKPMFNVLDDDSPFQLSIKASSELI